jgi:lysozyme
LAGLTRTRLARFVAVVALAACGPEPAAETPLGVDVEALCPAGAVVKGLDVSYYQGTVDWQAVASTGVGFAIARVGHGNTLDTQFETNWPAISQAGLVRGAYLYFQPATDANAQADMVVNAIGTLGPGDLPVVIDVEETGNLSSSSIVAELTTVVAKVTVGTGRSPIIYTGPSFWNTSVASAAFSTLPLWVANWGATCPTLPSAWSSWKLWQYSDTGSVNGIVGDVDLDEFNGDLAALKTFAGVPAYAAKVVSAPWPTMNLMPGQTVSTSLTVQNVGTATWDATTQLATTQPRDRSSDFAASGWVSPSRLAAVSGTVAPGASFQFNVTFHAPAQPGFYDELFGVVADGGTWMLESQIEAHFDVVAPPIPDAGSTMTPDAGHTAVPDAGQPVPDAGHTTVPDAGAPTVDAGAPVTHDAGMSDAGTPAVVDAGTSGTPDAGGPHDDAGAPDDPPDAGAHTSGPHTSSTLGAPTGCGCGESAGTPLALGLALLRRRRQLRHSALHRD